MSQILACLIKKHILPERIYPQWGFWQCLPFSWTTLRGKHCRHTIVVMGVVDTFGCWPIQIVYETLVFLY